MSPTSAVPSGPPTVTTNYLFTENETGQVCAFVETEVQPVVGRGPPEWRSLRVRVIKLPAGRAVSLDFGRGVAVVFNGQALPIGSELTELAFNVGGYRRAYSGGGNDRPSKGGANSKVEVADPEPLIAQLPAALARSEVSFSYRVNATGQAETWTMQPLVKPADRDRITAFTKCLERLGVPPAGPLPPPVLRS